MARKASVEHGADWVINNDADEFWVSKKGDLKDFLANVPENARSIIVVRHNAVVQAHTNTAFKATCHPRSSDIFEYLSYNNIGKPLPGKCIHRGSPNVVVAQGNHYVTGIEEGFDFSTDEISILHFPYRSFGHYKSKIELGGAAYERNRHLQRNVGSTWREHFKGLNDGTLETFWNNLIIEPKDVDARLQNNVFFGTLG